MNAPIRKQSRRKIKSRREIQARQSRHPQLAFECLEDRRVLAGASPLLDINATLRPDSSSYPQQLVAIGSSIYFVATTPEAGNGLFSYNTGSDQIKLLKSNIIQENNGSHLTSVGDTLYFVARDDVHGYELWKTDGTAGGTKLVEDIQPGQFSSYPRNLQNVNGTLFFTAGGSIMKTDGSSITQVTSGPSVSEFTNLNGTLYFTVGKANGAQALWKTDGSLATTVLVKEIGPQVISGSSFPSDLTASGSKIYFVANDGLHGAEIWSSDGTAAGTTLLKDLNPNLLDGFFGSDPRYLTDVDGTLFFAAKPYNGIQQLWQSDGTTVGTKQVVYDLIGSQSTRFRSLTSFNGSLFYTVNNSSNGNELWSIVAGNNVANLFKDIRPGTSGSDPRGLKVIDDQLYFIAESDAAGPALWTSDGSTVGTVKDTVISNGIYHVGIEDLIKVNGTLYFPANDGVHGYELWQAGTVSNSLAADIYSGTNDAISVYFGNGRSNAVLGDTFFFSADDGIRGINLWKSDGTREGTVLVKDLRQNDDHNSSVFEMISIGELVYFVADDGTTGRELWKSDGTEEGTVLVKDIVPDNGGSNPENLTDVNGKLFFTAQGRLWAVNDANEDPVQISDIYVSGGLFSVDDQVFFNSFGSETGNELWVSDGTVSGTKMVKDINLGMNSSYPRNLIDVDGTLFFFASDDLGSRLWKSDGTEAGTELVKDIDGGGSAQSPEANVNGILFFSASDEAGTSSGLWKSDGTEAGTVFLKEVSPGNLTNVNGTLFFNGRTDSRGYELWKSDGTPEGTVLVKDIVPGDGSSRPYNLTNVNGVLYFTAKDVAHGTELWKSDGTTAGTVLAKNITGNDGGSYPTLLTPFGSTLFFAATTDAFGNEFYAIPVDAAPLEITLSPQAINENVPAGSTVGTFNTTGATGTVTYTLVTGSADDDNASFAITDGSLTAIAAFDYETKSSYSIRVRSEDASGSSAERGFLINVENINEAPASADLSSFTVSENQPSGTVVGLLTAIDPDADDTHTYFLESGVADNDNFAIVGNELQTAAAFDFETKSNFAIAVTVIDAGGLAIAQNLTIIILDVFAESSVSVTGSILTYTDTSIDADNDLVLSVVAGKLRITDNNHPLAAGSGTTAVDANTIEVDALVSDLTAVNVLAGNGKDTITVQSLGNDFSADLSIDGQSGTDDQIFIGGSLQTQGGNVTLSASNGITIQPTGSVTTSGGELSINADSDLNNTGRYHQQPGSLVDTQGVVNGGDVIIIAADIELESDVLAGNATVTVKPSVAGENIILGNSTHAPSISLDDLNGKNGYKLLDVPNSIPTLRTATSIGDINGDGFDDLAFGSQFATSGPFAHTGLVSVIFGRSSNNQSSVDLLTLDGTNGFVIAGFSQGSTIGSTVSAAGDINGDGVADLVFNGRHGAGLFQRSYVLYGKDTSTKGQFPKLITTDQISGNIGFYLESRDVRYPHKALASAGDVNHDGFDDLLVGIPIPGRVCSPVNGCSGTSTGTSYVIFGSSNPTSLVLDDLNSTQGFKIPLSGGESVAGVGDFNGDGVDDIVIGNPLESIRGAAIFVFGKDTARDGDFALQIDPLTLQYPDGLRIVRGFFGSNVRSAGDINGDGFQDVFVGSYVFLGSADIDELTHLLPSDIDVANGFRIRYEGKFGSVGDVNGDGFDDIGFGGGTSLKRDSVVVFGSATSNGLDPADIYIDGINGYAVSGLSQYAQPIIENVGDVNGDEISDLLIYATHFNSQPTPNDAYIIYGSRGAFALTEIELTRIRTTRIILGDITTGEINVTDPISIQHAKTLELRSGSRLIDDNRVATDFSVGNLVLGAASTLSIRIGDVTSSNQHDRVAVTGNITLEDGARLEIELGDGYPLTGGEIVIVDNDGIDPIGGTFSGLDEGSLTYANGRYLEISYVGGDGNDITLSLPADADGDGVPDRIEAAAPGDQQANDNVASIPSAVTRDYVTLTAPAGQSFTNVAALPSATAQLPTGVETPLGFFRFNVSTVIGGTAAVTLAVPDGFVFDTYYKLSNTTAGYTVFTGAEFFDDDNDGYTDRIVLTLVDGGAGDADGIRNGVIVDPGAPAFRGFEVIESAGSTQVGESVTDSFEVRLLTKPLSDVVLSLQSSSPDALFLDKSSLTFTPDDWDLPQTVTSTATDDLSEIFGSILGSVSVSVDPERSEERFDALVAQSLTVLISTDVTASIDPVLDGTHFNTDGWNSAGNSLLGGYSRPDEADGLVEVSLQSESGLYWNGLDFQEGESSVVAEVENGQWITPIFADQFPEEGAYTLSVVAVDALGRRQQAPATSQLIYDTKTPSSSIAPLLMDANQKLINVPIFAAEDAGSVQASGVRTIELQVYERVQNSPTATALPTVVLDYVDGLVYPLSPQSNTTYYFRATAIDSAGNREAKPVGSEQLIYIGDIDAPTTSIVSHTINGSQIELAIEGTDAGNSNLQRFEVYVSIDGGEATKLPFDAIAGEADAQGIYHQQVTFIAQPGSHAYRFYSIGVDGSGNREQPPTPQFDVATGAVNVSAPATPQVTSIQIQNGQTQRSHVENIDVVFNSADLLDDLLANLATRVQLERRDLSGSIVGNIDLSRKVSKVGNALSFGFGNSLDDGFYRLKFDLDGDGDFDDLADGSLGTDFDGAIDFFRMLGDGNGDGKVDKTDARQDLNGDGFYDRADALLYRNGYLLHRNTIVDAFWLGERDDD
jgi:ELWxxDGT repeat protein